MKKKVVWLAVTGWMVAALLLASCAPAVVKEEEEKVVEPEKVVAPEKVVVPEKEANMVKWTGVKRDGTVVEKMLEKPRYGGVLTSVRNAQPTAFDDATPTGCAVSNWPSNLTNETLNTRDWTRGPLGTDEFVAQLSTFPGFGMETGLVAESWEVQPDALVFHIRQGIRWQDKPPVNGRELTADDVVWNLRRNYLLGYQQRNFTYLRYGMDKEGVEKSIHVSPTDKWAVVVENIPLRSGFQYNGTAPFPHILAPELHDGWDDKTIMTDWKKIVANGPFLLKEYVGASSLTYVRNPNYWRHDPFFPENQLPYVDGFKMLIISDMSTRQAALRTGKIDNLYQEGEIIPEVAETLMETNPELKWVTYQSDRPQGMINMRNDTKPFDDVRVRRALAMAINNQEILDDYYEGKAVLFAFPIPASADLRDMYIPLEQMPESVRELYEYHPDKARQLLAEAGYPDGFKTEVLCWSAAQIDLLSIIKEYWAKIGVDLKLDVRDYSVFNSMLTRRTYTQMVINTYRLQPWISAGLHARDTLNYSIINDAEFEELFEAMHDNYFDNAKVIELWTKPTATRPNMNTYANEQAWTIVLPNPPDYVFWQPWLKGFGGGTSPTWFGDPTYPQYVWLDQELKKAMGR